MPAGASTSSFASSPVPSVRERVIREYALSPLFGQRLPCCVLGFQKDPRQLLVQKPALRRVIAELLGCGKVADVELGSIQQTKAMMLHRSGTAASPRLADGPGSRPDAAQRRQTVYGRSPVVASTLIEVFLPAEEANLDEAEEASNDTILAHGRFLQAQILLYLDHCAVAPHGEAGEDGNLDNSMLHQGVVELCSHLGVMYCEVPALDETGFTFHELHGKEIDDAVAARVASRWEKRIDQLVQQKQ